MPSARLTRTTRTTIVFALLALVLGLVVAANPGGASASPPRPPDPQGPRPDDGKIGAAAVTETPELLFVPVAPCRIVDTRVAGGKMASGAVRSYYVGGTTGFAPQGGTSGGCGIPEGAKALSETVVAVSPSAGGYLKSWAAGGAEPGSSMLNYQKGAVVSTGTTVPLRSGAGTDLTVKNAGGSTHLVIDVNGYYIQQLQAYIASGGSVIDQSGRLVSSTKTADGQYTLVWDRDVSTCAGVGSSDLTGHIVSVYTSGANSYVYIVNNAGVAEDYWVHIAIHC